MSEADVLYIVARRALLDALEALGAQRSALILVGAQAIYLHTGQANLAVAVYTTDADLVVEPGALLMHRRSAISCYTAGFERGTQVGSWLCRRHAGPTEVTVPVDLLVPEAVGGSGREVRASGNTARMSRERHEAWKQRSATIGCPPSELSRRRTRGGSTFGLRGRAPCWWPSSTSSRSVRPSREESA